MLNIEDCDFKTLWIVFFLYEYNIEDKFLLVNLHSVENAIYIFELNAPNNIIVEDF